MLQLLDTASFLPSWPRLLTLMMEMIRSSKMPVLTTATQRQIPEVCILHSHHHENIKSCIVLLFIGQLQDASIVFILLQAEPE
jgi:hypothetical protein